ncbi:hypothetical protein RWE15_02470 [Virgibacillus halophilus]|uniref:Uncharacterized protein n=1 Tax=Tigheibacillus halophilus TaxID=361280 RepID=A0ABU5C4L2_9BACI|nr:hypothetical protein [Virgibacillus halophilus]
MKHNLLGKMQDLLTPFWKKICDGCHLNRDTLDMVKKAGMSIQKVEQHFKGLFFNDNMYQ